MVTGDSDTKNLFSSNIYRKTKRFVNGSLSVHVEDRPTGQTDVDSHSPNIQLETMIVRGEKVNGMKGPKSIVETRPFRV